MSGPNARFALPREDRDEIPALARGDAPTPGDQTLLASEAPGEAVAGGSLVPDELLPAASLSIERIARALDDAQFALGELKLARAQNDWPLFEATAKKFADCLNSPDVAALARALASTVHAARPRGREN